MKTTIDSSNIVSTGAGEMIKASYIKLGRTGATVDGYVQDCPATRYKIALRADGSGWEALYDQGGDDDGISPYNLYDIINIGRMDDSCITVSAALIEGARELRSWADRIWAIDEDNEALAEVADYLCERAYAATTIADDVKSCNELADDLGMDHEDGDDVDGYRVWETKLRIAEHLGEPVEDIIRFETIHTSRNGAALYAVEHSCGEIRYVLEGDCGDMLGPWEDEDEALANWNVEKEIE